MNIGIVDAEIDEFEIDPFFNLNALEQELFDLNLQL